MDFVIEASTFCQQDTGCRKGDLALLAVANVAHSGVRGGTPGCAIFVYIIRTQNTMAHRRPLGQRPCDKAHAALAFLTVPNKRTGTFLLPELVGLKRNVCEISKVPLALQLLNHVI